MDSYVYLIENGDLYNIGSTNNIDKVQQLLRPGKLCASLKDKEAVYICKNLHIRYSEVRLPETDYFRLNKSQLLECQLMMKSEGASNYFQPIFKGGTMVATFILAWLGITFFLIKLGIDPILSRFL